MTDNFYKLISDIKPHIQETNRTQSRINDQKIILLRNIIFPLQKIKDTESQRQRGWR